MRFDKRQYAVDSVGEFLSVGVHTAVKPSEIIIIVVVLAYSDIKISTSKFKLLRDSDILRLGHILYCAVSRRHSAVMRAKHSYLVDRSIVFDCLHPISVKLFLLFCQHDWL